MVEANRAHPPYAMLDATGAEVEPVTAFLRDLALGDSSPLTCRSYGYGMLRWFRLLWLLGTGWERATESEVAVLTGWLRSAVHPHRHRHRHRADAPVFDEDVIRHYLAHLNERRQLRDVTSDEWEEFEEHFDSARSNSAHAGAPTAPPASMNTPASGAPCSRSARR
ncbi:hypothetical protein [Streptomyces sp. DT2A-34]|uniref:hypothetical protein n=1 Tax=Streptomyces sp. DT2A-34 TaxID=3051182 RepID=UPI00346418C7